MVNDALQQFGGGTVASVTLNSRNRVTVRYGMLHANLELPVAMETGPSPRLTLSLASVVVAWTLRAAVRQSFLHFHGRHVTIDLAEVPALAEWRDAWRHIQSLHITTAPRELQLEFAIAIDGDLHA